MIDFHPSKRTFLAAESISWTVDLIGTIREKLTGSFRTPARAEDCRTAAELRAYACSIMRTQPGFAKELIAAADRSEQESQ